MFTETKPKLAQASLAPTVEGRLAPYLNTRKGVEKENSMVFF